MEFALPARDEALAWLRARGHAAEVATAALAAARGHPGLADAWLTEGGLALRDQVKAELEAVGKGRAGAIETAQRWLADEHGEQRLRFAADLAVDGAAHAIGAGPAVRGLSVPGDAAAVAAWFDALNRMRSQLPAPLRHDLVLAGLLREWRTMHQSGPGPGPGGTRR